MQNIKTIILAMFMASLSAVGCPGSGDGSRQPSFYSAGSPSGSSASNLQKCYTQFPDDTSSESLHVINAMHQACLPGANDSRLSRGSSPRSSFKDHNAGLQTGNSFAEGISQSGRIGGVNLLPTQQPGLPRSLSNESQASTIPAFGSSWGHFAGQPNPNSNLGNDNLGNDMQRSGSSVSAPSFFSAESFVTPVYGQNDGAAYPQSGAELGLSGNFYGNPANPLSRTSSQISTPGGAQFGPSYSNLISTKSFVQPFSNSASSRSNSDLEGDWTSNFVRARGFCESGSGTGSDLGSSTGSKGTSWSTESGQSDWWARLRFAEDLGEFNDWFPGWLAEQRTVAWDAMNNAIDQIANSAWFDALVDWCEGVNVDEDEVVMPSRNLDPRFAELQDRYESHTQNIIEAHKEVAKQIAKENIKAMNGLTFFGNTLSFVPSQTRYSAPNPQGGYNPSGPQYTRGPNGYSSVSGYPASATPVAYVPVQPAAPARTSYWTQDVSGR